VVIHSSSGSRKLQTLKEGAKSVWALSLATATILVFDSDLSIVYINPREGYQIIIDKMDGVGYNRQRRLCYPKQDTGMPAIRPGAWQQGQSGRCHLEGEIKESAPCAPNRLPYIAGAILPKMRGEAVAV
jgi:hypothetical protein